jgi:uncharacterized protein (DUF2147 family)
MGMTLNSYLVGASLAAAALVAALSPAAAHAAAPSILGMWHTGTEGGKVEIYRCGTAYCGKVADADRLRTDPNLRDVRNSNASLRDRRLKGLVVLQGFEGGPALFKGGPVYDPETGDGASRGELKLLPSGKLEVKGCVAFFCRTKIWTRAG